MKLIQIDEVTIEVTTDSKKLPKFIHGVLEHTWNDGESRIWVYTSTGQVSQRTSQQVIRTASQLLWRLSERTKNLREIKKQVIVEYERNTEKID